MNEYEDVRIAISEDGDGLNITMPHLQRAVKDTAPKPAGFS